MHPPRVAPHPGQKPSNPQTSRFNLRIVTIAALPLLLIPFTHAADVGRYQVLPATITTTTDTGVQIQNQTLIKLDTQTGQSWELVSLNIQGRPITGWGEIKTFKPGEAIVTDAELRAIQERNQSSTPPTASKPAQP